MDNAGNKSTEQELAEDLLSIIHIYIYRAKLVENSENQIENQQETKKNVFDEWLNTSNFVYNKTVASIGGDFKKVNFLFLRDKLVTANTKKTNPEYQELEVRTKNIKNQENLWKKNFRPPISTILSFYGVRFRNIRNIDAPRVQALPSQQQVHGIMQFVSGIYLLEQTQFNIHFHPAHCVIKYLLTCYHLL